MLKCARTKPEYKTRWAAWQARVTLRLPECLSQPEPTRGSYFGRGTNPRVRPTKPTSCAQPLPVSGRCSTTHSVVRMIFTLLTAKVRSAVGHVLWSAPPMEYIFPLVDRLLAVGADKAQLTRALA